MTKTTKFWCEACQQEFACTDFSQVLNLNLHYRTFHSELHNPYANLAPPPAGGDDDK